MRAIALLGAGLMLSINGLCAAEEAGRLDPAKLVGTWVYVSGEKDGKTIPAEQLAKASVEITKETITLKSPESEFVIKYKLDTAKHPCQIAMEITKGPQGEGSKSDGIIALKDGELKICYPAMGGDAPKDFATKEGSGLHLFVLKPKK